MTNVQIAKLYLATHTTATADQIDAAILDGTATQAVTALSIADFLEAAYQATFDRSVDAEGAAYWANEMTNGMTQEELLAALPAGAAAYVAPTAENPLVIGNQTFTAAQDGIDTDNDAAIASNKSAAEVTAIASGISDGNTASILSTVTVSTGGGVADDTAGNTAGDTTTVVSDEKQMVVLTDGRDNVTTGSNDDIIYGDAGQNQNGAIANAFSTGDRIDGGDGYDTLITTLIGDQVVDNGGVIDINAHTDNIEKVVFEVIDNAVSVDAGNMDSVEEYWSDNSDNVALTLEDVRLGDLDITKDITFGMRDVDFSSGLTVQFDSASLTNAGDSKSDSKVSIKLIDATALTVDEPVGNVSVTIGFDVAGDSYTLANIVSTDGTYEGLKAAIATDLAVKGLTDLSVSLGSSFTELTTGVNTTQTLTGVTAHEIIITDGSGDPFSNVTFTQAAVTAVPTGFTVAGVAASVDASTSSSLIESNLILDNAGRGSTAGNVNIGAMSNSNKGVEQFNVSVDDSSAINSLTTTNTKLQKVVIDSIGEKGDLEIGSIAGWNAAINTATTTAVLTSIDATAFTGTNLMLGTTADTDNPVTATIEGTVISNLNTLSANIAANVTFLGSTTEIPAHDSDEAYSYTTGSGADRIQFTLDGNSVDAQGESFALTTNGGNDTVTMTMGAGVSQVTMTELSNLTIDLGTGNDTLNLDAYGNFNIDAGTGDDYVHVNSLLTNGSATSGTWTFGQATGTQTFGTGFGDAAMDARVLYQATLTLTFAGIEETVNIATDIAGNFTATQLTINTAIKAAITANTELSKLLTATDVTGTEQLNVVSTIGGLNDLGIAIYQPQLVATSAAVTTGTAAGENVLLAAADLTAIKQGLINTTSLNSDALTTAAAVVGAVDVGAAGTANLFSGAISSTGAGSEVAFSTKDISHDVTIAVGADAGTADIFDAAGAANYYDVTAVASSGTSTNDATGINFSTINLNSGNDLVVLHSNLLSANIVKVDGSFGTNTIVNFLDVSPNDVAATNAAVGNHALEFAFLDNQVDASVAVGNTQSAVPVAVTVNNVTGATAFADSVVGSVNATANSVNILRFIEDVATPAALETWDGLTDAKMLAALNSTAAANDWGNIGTAGVNLAAAAYGTTLVSTTQKHILMVENGLNQGEYKVYELTSTLNAAGVTVNAANVATPGFFTSAKEIGVMDFGSSINVQVVGSNAWSVLLTGNNLDGTVADANGGLIGASDIVASFNSGDTVDVAVANILLTSNPAVVYSLNDTSAALAGAGATLNTAANITASDAATVALATTILAATNSGTTTYSITDTATNLVAGATINAATNLVASDTATVAQGEVIADATNSGTATFAVSDTIVNLKIGAALNTVAAKNGLVDASSVTVTVASIADGAEEVVFNNTAAATAATTIDFVDNAVTLTQAELVALVTTTTTLLLTDADVVTVTGVTATTADFTEAAEIDKLNTGDIITADANAITLNAANYTSVFTTQNITATVGDVITITTLDSATVAGSEATDTLVFVATDTGVTATGFTAGTDKIDLNALTADTAVTATGPAVAYTAAVDDVLFFSGGAAGDADTSAASITFMNSELNFTDTANIFYAVVVDDDSSAIYKITPNAAGNEFTGDTLALIGTVDAVLTTGDIAFA